MKRTVPWLVTALLITSTIAMIPLGGASARENSDARNSGTATLPGEQLAGVVGVQEAELNGELASRVFGIKVAQAETNEARADVLAEQLHRNEQQLYKLDAHHETLREQRDGGDISVGAYRAQVAIAVAETHALNRTTNQEAAVAADLPDDLRENRGISNESIQVVQDRAQELTGPDIAEIARGIAGDRVGTPVNPDGRPDYERSGDNSASDGGQSADEKFDATDRNQ